MYLITSTYETPGTSRSQIYFLQLATEFPLQLSRISWSTLAATSLLGQAYNIKALPPNYNRYNTASEVLS